MSRIAILGGELIDPTQSLNGVGDLFIDGDRILAVGSRPAGFVADREIDARGCWVMPGLIDLGCRLREPGAEHKATIASESRAAVRGGITTLCCMPDTDPVIDEAATVELIHRRADDAGHARVVPLGAMTQGLRGEQLSEMATLSQAGCHAISNASRPIADTRVMRRAMEYAATFDLTMVLQPLDPWLAEGGCAHEGPVAARMGLAGVPVAAETVALTRLLELVAQTGVRAHFTRLSSARALDMLARAKDEGLPVSADVSINNLHLSEHDIYGFNSQCHLRPPLRSNRDREALCAGLASGLIDVVCSDHQPHDPDAKLAPFPATEAGASGLDTLLPLLARLVEGGQVPRARAIDAVAGRVATVLGLEQGRLAAGAPADVAVYDPRADWQVSTDTLLSAGRNSPYLGWEMSGRCRHTLVAGRVFDFN